MIIGLDNVLEYLRLSGCNFFQVRISPDKENFIFRSDNEEEGLAERIERFKAVMAVCKHEKLYLEGWINKGQLKNWYRTWFCLSPAYATNGSVAISGTPTPSPANIDEIVSEKVNAMLDRRELEDLRRSYAQLEKEYESVIAEQDTVKQKMLAAVQPHIGSIVGMIASKILPQTQQIAVAGLSSDNTFAAERLQSVCERLERLDPNYVIILEQLAFIGEKNPAMIEMAKSTLTNFYNSLQ